MKDKYAWTFHAGKFSDAAQRFPESEEPDCSTYLESLGWIHAFKMGEESISVLEIDCWQKQKESEFLIDVWNCFYGMGMVICPSFPDFLLFVERFLAPIVALSSTSRLADIFSEFEEKLLDSETGMAPAQRYAEAARQRRWRAKK